MKTKKILIVSAEYYPEITMTMETDVIDCLKKWKDFSTENSRNDLENVPGIFEIPVIIAKNIKKYDGFIALGCVIKGETPHFDFISSAAINGIMDLSIKHEMPIMNGIVTCLNKDQAIERCNPNKKNNGGKAAQALLHLLGISKEQNEAK